MRGRGRSNPLPIILIIRASFRTDPSQPQAAWSLQEGWVAQEAKALLPPKTSGRSNLIQCYQALMLTALMDVKLFEVRVFVLYMCIRLYMCVYVCTCTCVYMCVYVVHIYNKGPNIFCCNFP